MTGLDWSVIALYGAVLVGIGLLQSRKAKGGVDDYFVSGRRLRWWAAGTSMIAASFASDTPLFVSSVVRKQGIWGNWAWWGLGISTVLTAFFFARLWRRSEVITEAELTELRYSGRVAAGLRGFKAVYWGLLWNAFTTGAWGVVGLATVATVMTGIEPKWAILGAAALGATYSAVSGLWGVVATDMLQFVLAIAGAVVLAGFSVHAAGGMGAITSAVSADRLEIVPLQGDGLWYLLTFVLVQWWAWKNTDGGGMLVQRMAACRSEREAVYATLWYNVVHYGLRSWPWVIVALASIVVIPQADPQQAYVIMMRDHLPAGLRGLLVAWFLAEFVASFAGAMNWGGSLLVNDLYRRFMGPGRSEGHYLAVARVVGLLVVAGAVVTAFLSGDLVTSFGYVLKGTAATGVVLAARWLWWRINSWSEISAMVVSPLMTFLVVPWIDARFPMGEMGELLAVLAGSLPVVLLATFVTRPDDDVTLERFYRKVRPPGPGWKRIAARCPGVEPSMSLVRIAGLWLAGTAMVYALMIGLGSLVLGRPLGLAGVAAGGVLLVFVIRQVRRWEAA